MSDLQYSSGKKGIWIYLIISFAVLGYFGSRLQGQVMVNQTVVVQGDVDGDGIVNLYDYSVLSSHWLRTDCGDPNWCGGADLNQDAIVDTMDLYILLNNWTEDNINRLEVEHANSYPTRLAQGPEGKIYVSNVKTDSVFIYDTNLTLVGELKGLAQPLGVAVDSEGRIYVGSNLRKCVEVYDDRGRKVKTIGVDEIDMPNDMVVDRQNNLYVVDSLSHTIKVFDAQGRWQYDIGSQGSNPGEFQFPVDVEITYWPDEHGVDTGRLLVADQGHYVVQIFNLAGAFLEYFGGQATQGMVGWKWQGKFVRLQSLATDGLGQVHAVDSFMNKVQIFETNTWTFSEAYGSFGTGPGQLNLPLDIVITNDGKVIAANTENQRVEIIYQIPQ